MSGKNIIVAAISRRGVIGKTCPWCKGVGEYDEEHELYAAERLTCSACCGLGAGLAWGDLYGQDRVRFKTITMGKPIVMGRCTWQSLPRRPLPGRPNVVISRTMTSASVPGARVFESLPHAIECLRDNAPDLDICIIGGRGIYEAALPIADVLELTLIDADHEGDVIFPGWTSHSPDERMSTDVARRSLPAGFALAADPILFDDQPYAFTRWERVTR